jgi:signal transduction histidine kinase
MDKINILLVDNNPAKLLTYEAMLAELGENIISVKSGDEALEHLLKTDVPIVLSDVKMPDMDGFELADMIRSHPRHKDTAIILISAAFLSDADRLKGYEHGAVDYISVPVVPELLRARVRVFAELYRRRKESEKLYAEMRRLSGLMIGLQDDERRRIARELHDSLGQQLTVAKMAADLANVKDVSELIEEAMRQVRSLSHLLHPPLLDEIGLLPALQWLLDGLSKRSGIQAALDPQPNEFPRFRRELENAVFRIIQEAVTNAFRHSGCHNICVVLRHADGLISLAVRDDGKGISEQIAALAPGSFGVGVGGMRQRAMELGGELKLKNAKPGTLIEAVIPADAVEPATAIGPASPAQPA